MGTNQVIKVISAIGIGIGILIFKPIPGLATSDWNSNSNHAGSTFDRLKSGSDKQIAQAPPSSDRQNSPPKQLDPSPPPLSLPNRPEAVELGEKIAISLKEAVRLSLENNQDVVEARQELKRAEAALRQERAALYPSLDLTSDLIYGDALFLDSISTQTREMGAPAGMSAGSAESFDFSGDLALSYTIFDSGLRSASIRIAEKQLRSSQLDLEAILEDVRLETASDYYDLQNRTAEVEIEQSTVQDATKTLEDARLRQSARVGTKFDVLRAEVELAQAKQGLITAQANRDIARRQLAETLSLDHQSDLTAADEIAESGVWELSLPETIVKAFENREELEQFLLQREIAQSQRQVAIAAVRPTISASSSYGVSDDFEDNFDITDSYSVGLSLEWRLFDGGAASAAAEQSEQDEAIAETQFAERRNEIRFAVEQAFYQLRSNQSNIDTATQEVTLADESLRIARLRFQSGVGTQTDVIDAQAQLATARGNLLGSIIDYNQSYIDLQRQVSQVAEP